MLKITLAELKKSLYAIKNNNTLQCISGEQIGNMDKNIIFPLVNLYDILNGTLNILNILNNRGFIDVKKIFEDDYEQTESITINPILNSELKIPLFKGNSNNKVKVNTLYSRGDIVLIYPINNNKSKYLRGIVDKYRFFTLFINVFDITGTAWKVKNTYNIHKDYSYQYIIKLPMTVNSKIFNNLNILKIDLSYFFKTLYTFILPNNDKDNNEYIIDKKNLEYDKILWTINNVTINNYELILEQINILKVNVDNIYNMISQYNL